MLAQLPIPLPIDLGGGAVIGTIVVVCLALIVWNNRVKLGLVKDPNAPVDPNVPVPTPTQGYQSVKMRSLTPSGDPFADLITQIENLPIAKALDVQAQQILTMVRCDALVLVRPAIDECPDPNDQAIAMSHYTALMTFVAASGQAKTPSGVVISNTPYVPVFPPAPPTPAAA